MGSKIHCASQIHARAQTTQTRRTVSFRFRSEMTSRRVPVPNPKFARSPSSDDEKDDPTSTTTKGGVSKQQAKMNNTTNKRAASKKTSSVEEALVVATTTTTKKNGPSGTKDAEKTKEALVQPSKILIPQNGDEGPKKWRLADQRRCALNVITRTRLNHRFHHHRVKSKEEEKDGWRRSRPCPFSHPPNDAAETGSPGEKQHF
jgi:hypothetical protein